MYLVSYLEGPAISWREAYNSGSVHRNKVNADKLIL